tara:strand:+ start:184 stop:324 length:141 start_codon:yes stop_codon:yes gene_type:complete
MRIEVYIVPIFVLISVIALAIVIYKEERNDGKVDAKHHLKNKESRK